jgi:MerR family transcriptional regulator, light-induced transcriptional regulator
MGSAGIASTGAVSGPGLAWHRRGPHDEAVQPEPAVPQVTGSGGPDPVRTADGDDDGHTGGDPDQPLLGVAAAARRLGIAPATLRTWDRRYGLGPSDHTPGQHRRYSPDDLARLDLMRRALLRGASVGDAARLATAAPPGHRGPSRATGVPSRPAASPLVEDGAHAAGQDTTVEVPQAAGGGVLRLGHVGPAARGLGRAAAALDVDAVRGLLAEALAEAGVVGAWDEVVRPVLTAVGARWALTGAVVEVEHLLTSCVLAAFGARAAAAPAAPSVLLASMPGDQHTLASTALAAALAELGIGSRPLGADLPVPALATAIRRTAPAVVFLWSQTTWTADTEVLEALPRTRPRFGTFVGGPGWDDRDLPPRVVRLGSLTHACSEISRTVMA